MQVTVQLFAAAKAAAEGDSITVEVSDAATADEVLRALGQHLPEIEPLLASSRLAADDCYVDRAERINAGQDVALILPVSGG